MFFYLLRKSNVFPPLLDGFLLEKHLTMSDFSFPSPGLPAGLLVSLKWNKTMRTSQAFGRLEELGVSGLPGRSHVRQVSGHWAVCQWATQTLIPTHYVGFGTQVYADSPVAPD